MATAWTPTSIAWFRTRPRIRRGATHLRLSGRSGREAQERDLLASLSRFRELVLDIRGKRLVVNEVLDGLKGQLLLRLMAVEHNDARMGKLDSVRSFDGSRQVLDVGDEERRSCDSKLVGYRARSVHAVSSVGRSAHQALQRLAKRSAPWVQVSREQSCEQLYDTYATTPPSFCVAHVSVG